MYTEKKVKQFDWVLDLFFLSFLFIFIALKCLDFRLLFLSLCCLAMQRERTRANKQEMRKINDQTQVQQQHSKQSRWVVWKCIFTSFSGVGRGHHKHVGRIESEKQETDGDSAVLQRGWKAKQKHINENIASKCYERRKQIHSHTIYTFGCVAYIYHWTFSIVSLFIIIFALFFSAFALNAVR